MMMLQQGRRRQTRPWFVTLLALLTLSLVVSGCDLGAGTGHGGGGPDAGAVAAPVESAGGTGAPAASSGAGAGAAAPAESAAAATGDDSASMAAYQGQAGGGGGNNIVRVVNRTDDRLVVRGHVRLNQIPGPTVGPVNEAIAQSSCTNCQTFAVALQVNLISRSARRVTPRNTAVAVNYECTNCYTVARALQYVYSVDDPTQVPPEVSALLREMDHELKAISRDRDMTLAEAEARINAVVARFSRLAESLNDQRDETRVSTTPNATPITDEEPGAEPSPSAASSGDAPRATAEAETAAGEADQAAPGSTSTPTPGPTPVATPASEPTATPSS